MANLRLKKLILEVVNNQLRDNDPPITKEVYEKLLKAGYSVSEAKERIGAVVLAEVYDVMKENQSYDEERYTNALEEMLQQCIGYEAKERENETGMPVQQPVVKDTKIYPNAPCPCGSGKKYKKCCGKK